MSVRVGLLGPGGIGARHAAAARAVDDLTHVAVCGRDAARREAFAGSFQLADLRDAIVLRRAPRAPLRDGLATLKLVLAARRSANERREIAL